MSKTNSQEDSQWGRGNQTSTASKPMQEILPGLYLGDLRAAENMEDLRSNNISFVLTIKYQNLSLATRRAYLKARISQIHIQKQDCLHEELLTTFEPACDLIDGKLTKGQAVLVHCALGRSRSATVVIAYVMRHLAINYHAADAFVRTKRAVIDPNFQFREQLKMWGNSGFDFQNLLIENTACTMYLSCTPNCRQVMAEGEQQAKQQAKGGQKEVEEEKGHKEYKDEKEAKEVKKEGEDGENEKAEGKDKEQAQIPEEDGVMKEAKTEAEEVKKEGEDGENGKGSDEGKDKEQAQILKEDEGTKKVKTEAEEVKKEGEDGENGKGSDEGKDKEQVQIPKEDEGTKEVKTEASPSAPDSIEESTSPQSIEAELGNGLGMHVKSQGPPNIDNQSAADGPCDDIDTASTESPQIDPAPKVVRAAIERLYLKYPAMGKKKLLRILNASRGWSIGNKEFRSYLETIVAG